MQEAAHASTALTLVLHQSRNACTANRHLRNSKESNGEQRRTLVEL